MPRVEIYTAFLCPYCARAKSLLDRKGVSYAEHDVTGDRQGRAAMAARSNGRSTVPQIFVGERHIGGSDDLAVAERNGELDQLLTA